MLDIYESALPSSVFSVAGAFTNPFSLTIDGLAGGVIKRKIYLRNDDSLYYYENITVQPIDGGHNIVSGTGITEGFSWKLIAGDSEPLVEQWGQATAGASISLVDIGSAGNADTSTYLPFWVRVEAPPGATIDSYNTVTLRISFDESSV